MFSIIYFTGQFVDTHFSQDGNNHLKWVFVISDQKLSAALTEFPVSTEGMFKDSYVFEFAAIMQFWTATLFPACNIVNYSVP